MKENEANFIKLMTTILDERSKRIMLGAYAKCLGHGGITAVSNESGMSRTTITTGQQEAAKVLASPEKYKATSTKHIRAEGGGRKTATEHFPDIIEKLTKLLDGNTIGNPESPLCWTTKSLRNLQDALKEEGISVSYPTIGTILESMGFSLQQNKKYVEGGKGVVDRNEQFCYINENAKQFISFGLPVISVDIKKKELIGNFKNNGVEYRKKKDPLKVNDHDFQDSEKGKASPYGIYDIGKNQGFVMELNTERRKILLK